jgi:hypothetical protein
MELVETGYENLRWLRSFTTFTENLAKSLNGQKGFRLDTPFAACENLLPGMTIMLTGFATQQTT